MNPKDQRAIQSRQAIMAAGIRALLKNPRATFMEIAQEAGIGRATLYRHFDSRQTLVAALAKQCLEETDEVTLPLRGIGLRGKSAIVEGIKVIMPLADKYRFLLNLWNMQERDAATQEIYERQLDEFYYLVEQAKEDGDVRNDMSSAWLTAVMDSLLSNAWWMVAQGELSSEEAADLFIVTLFEGIQP